MKSLESRTEDRRVGLRDGETVEINLESSNGSQGDWGGCLGTVLRGGVPLKNEASPEETPDEDPENTSPSLSLSSNPTPGETGSVSQPDRGCEG